MGFDDKEFQTVILAALLHDIGKISQREGGEYYTKHSDFSGNFISSLRNYFGDDLTKDIANLIEKHHEIPSTRNEYIIHIADKLAAGERVKEERGQFKSNEAALLAVTSRINFRKDCGKEKFYRLDSLKISKEVLFPKDRPFVEERGYERVWNGFIKKIGLLKKYQPYDFTTLFFILKEFGTFVPSATPWEEDQYNRTIPDISLFDHSKVTCAIAACLKKLSEDDFSNTEMLNLIETLKQHHKEMDIEKRRSILESSQTAQKPLFILLRGDIAGIQKFIYSITKPKAETKGTSKRLRGRSFYISLLTDVISDWIIREMQLPIPNLLFCGGGRFDILIPNSDFTKKKLKNLQQFLDEWLLEEFYGELSIQLVVVEVAPKDFFEFNQIYKKAEDKLSESKMKKFNEMITKGDFFHSTEQVSDLCNVCLIVPVSKGQICQHCETHFKIGSDLPKKEFISFVYGKCEEFHGTEIPFEDFGVTVLLQNEEEMEKILNGKLKLNSCIFSINPKFSQDLGLEFLKENINEKPVSFGFKFLGNSVPIGIDGEVLEFEGIANRSTGAKYLGILKMDIDYLGLLFSLGINNPSISRIATLSSNLEIFFGAWLNQICENLGSVFYIVYSGGDDLFIIGPWDKIIELSLEIYKDFREYTCQNPNITLSGGILLVKPQFPIHRFAQLVTEELEKSKHDADKLKEKGINEKNRVTVFGETVEWKDGSKSFEELIKFAKVLCEKIEAPRKDIPKGFIYYLRQLEIRFKDKMWVPYFLYSLTRRIKDEEVKIDLQRKVPGFIGKMKIPVSYVSLKTRKEE